MSDENSLVKIPHFDGYYDHWSELMENLLRAKGLWSLVEEGYEELPTGEITRAQQKTYDDAKMKDHRVKHYLFQALDRVVFEQILDRRNSKIIWESMKRKFGGNERVRRSLLQTLRRDFELISMKTDENIDDYFGRVMAISNKMRSNGEDMLDTKIVEKILRTLTEKFTYVVISIEESNDTSSMTIDELQSSLSTHEKKFKKQNYEEEDHALTVRGRGRGYFRGRGRGRGRGRSFNKAVVEFYQCHNLGHFQYECPNGSGAHYAEHEGSGAHYAELKEKEEVLLMSYVELQETKRGDVWFVDSGCSNHMCGDHNMFSSIDTTINHSVKLGNNHKLEVSGTGVVKIILNGISYVLNDADYVPELKKQFIKCWATTRKGARRVVQRRNQADL